MAAPVLAPTTEPTPSLDALLAAEHVVLEGEDPALFEALHAALVSENEPEGPTDRLLVHRLAVAHWTRLRCDRFARKLIAWAPRVRYITEAGPEIGDPEAHFDLRRYNALRAHQAQLHREIAQITKELARRRAERTRADAGRNEPERRRRSEPDTPAVEAPGNEPKRAAAGLRPRPAATPRNEPDAPRPNRRERRRLEALARRRPPVQASASPRG